MQAHVRPKPHVRKHNMEYKFAGGEKYSLICGWQNAMWQFQIIAIKYNEQCSNNTTTFLLVYVKQTR